MLEEFKLESLSTQWEVDKVLGDTSNATRVISQATAYAADGGIKFFVISTYEVTWLARVLQRGYIEITKGFAWNDVGPSVLQVGYFYVRWW